VKCLAAREYMWVSVAAVNGLGDGGMSESLKVKCAQIPSNDVNPLRANGSDNSITLEYAAVDTFFDALLYNATLLGFKVSYAAANNPNSLADGWQLWQSLTVGATNRQYTVSGLLGGWPYKVRVQAITEVGLNEVIAWEQTVYSGGTPYALTKPMFAESDGETITMAWQPAVLTRSAQLLTYVVYISGDNRSKDINQTYEIDATGTWPSRSTPEQPVPMPLATIKHNCGITPTQLPNGTGISEDRRSNFIYVRIATRTAASVGALSDVAALFCAARPDAPIVSVVDHDEKQVTLQWTTTNLNGAPLVAYNIFADDGLGGDLTLVKRLEGRNATLYDPVYKDEYAYSTRITTHKRVLNKPPAAPTASTNTTIINSTTPSPEAPETYTEEWNTSVTDKTLLDYDRPWMPLLFSYPITGLKPYRHYRFQVSVVSAAAESERSTVQHAGTCIAHATAPTIDWLPLETAVNLTWHAPDIGPLDCQVYGYQVFYQFVSELVEEYFMAFDDEANETRLSKRMVVNYSTSDLTLTMLPTGTVERGANDTVPLLIDPSVSSYIFSGLTANANYRFKVRTITTSGHRDSQWVSSEADGVPSMMPAPTHDIAGSSTTSVALSWASPNMNGGPPVGYEVFRDNGPGTAVSQTADTTCLAITSSACIPPNCAWDTIARVPTALGCTVPGLKKDTFYRFRVRALNTYGAGPLSPVAELPTGTVPFARAPTMNRTSFDNCTLTVQWPAAVERGTVVYSYVLKLADAYADPQPSNASCTDASGIYCIPVEGQPVWVMSGVANDPFDAMQATVDTSNWAGLIPGSRYKAAVRARSTIAESAWSEWSDLETAPKGYCLSLPAAPTGLQRDPDGLVRSGQIQIKWNAVTKASEAGGDDPVEGHVAYDVWARSGLSSVWRRLSTLPSHVDTQAAPASLTVDTYPETSLGSTWQFKVRVGNRNGVFGPFCETVDLSSGRIPTAPRSMQASFSSRGRVYLYWEAPSFFGEAPITKYQVRCTETAVWEDVANTELEHVLTGKLPVGVTPCFVRAVNDVGPGPAATASVTVLQPIVEIS